MAASIDTETESGTFVSRPAHLRNSWGFDRPWWAQDEVSETPDCCPAWQQ
jgi:hypothetical protein